MGITFLKPYFQLLFLINLYVLNSLKLLKSPIKYLFQMFRITHRYFTKVFSFFKIDPSLPYPHSKAGTVSIADGLSWLIKTKAGKCYWVFSKVVYVCSLGKVRLVISDNNHRLSGDQIVIDEYSSRVKQN